MKITTPRIPSGFPEYLPEEQIAFNRLIDIIKSTYEKYGFSPLDTPDLELSEVLLTKSGGETEKQIYRFTKGSNDLTMRFDLTVPLARYVAQHEGQLTFPFRRYQIGKVHRGERAQAGRFREFYQCDADIIGSESPLVDAEFPAMINEILSKFGFGEFTIRLNNRLILNGFFEGLGIKDKAVDILRLIDKIEKITPEEYQKQLQSLDLNSEQINKINQLTNISGDNNQRLDALKNLCIESTQFKQGLDKITTLVQTLRYMGVPESRFLIDMKITRGLDYYTGTVWETFLDDFPELGSVFSGGRYDNLASHYTKSNLPGVGTSIGISRLFYKLKELGVLNIQSVSPAKVMVASFSESQIPFALDVATKLRANNIPTVLFTENSNLKKKFKYADKMGFEYVILIGEEEVSSEKITVKNMKNGENKTIKLEEFIEEIQND